MPERHRCSAGEPACQPRNTHIFLSSLVMTNQREQERIGTWHFPGGNQPPSDPHRSTVFHTKSFVSTPKSVAGAQIWNTMSCIVFFGGSVLNGYLNSQTNPKAFMYYWIDPLTAIEIPSHLLRLPCPTMFSQIVFFFTPLRYVSIWQWINLMASFLKSLDVIVYKILLSYWPKLLTWVVWLHGWWPLRWCSDVSK